MRRLPVWGVRYERPDRCSAGTLAATPGYAGSQRQRTVIGHVTFDREPITKALTELQDFDEVCELPTTWFEVIQTNRNYLFDKRIAGTPVAKFAPFC